MKKTTSILLTLAFIAFSLVSFSQNKTDANGNKQGKWVKKNDKGTVLYVGEFKNDKPIGKFVYYYPSGKASTVLNYQNESTAKCKMYHKSGNLMAVGRYVNQKKDSTWWYFNDYKQVLSQETYANGELDGYTLKYYASNSKNPQVLEQKLYADGKANGPWKQFYSNGDLKMEGFFKNGLQQGKCTWKNPGGTIDNIGYYKNGKKHGWWRQYDDEREIISEAYYWNGSELKGKVLEDHLKIMKEIKKQK